MNYKAGLLIITCILLFLCSCNKSEEDVTREDLHEKEGIPVEVVTVEKGDIVIMVKTQGELRADDAVTVSTNNKGLINEIYVKEGQYIKSGQTIAVIEPDDLEDQTSQAQSALNAAYTRLAQARSTVILMNSQVEGAIKQARAGVEAAEASYNQALAALEASRENLSLLKEGFRSQEIAQVEQAVIQAKANLREAELDLGRMERLCKEGAVAQQQLDTARVKYDVALSQYNSAQEQLDLFKEGYRSQEIEAAQQQVNISEAACKAALAKVKEAKEGLEIAISSRLQVTLAGQTVDVAEADVEQAKANLARISRNLEKAFVKAPISGYVTKLYVEKGEYTNNANTTSIIDLFDPGSLYFEGIISEKDIANVNEGLSVDIKVDGVPDKTFTGYIKEIIPQASGSRQFTAKISVNEAKTDLKPGMFARGDILLASHNDVLVISDKCIKTQDDKTCVFIVKDLKAVRKDIVKGPSMNNKSEVMDGLEEGDTVISSGFVKEGDMVNVIHEE